MSGGDTSKFKYRVVNDSGDRIAQFQDMGYELVSDPDIQIGDRRVANPTKEGSPIKVSVGGGMTGYLMRQTLENFNEDQTAKAEFIKKSESSIKREAQKSADYGNVRVGREA
jgi:hypothetical protein